MLCVASNVLLSFQWQEQLKGGNLTETSSLPLFEVYVGDCSRSKSAVGHAGFLDLEVQPRDTLPIAARRTPQRSSGLCRLKPFLR